EVLVDGLGLGRRFDDDDLHGLYMTVQNCPYRGNSQKPCAVAVNKRETRLRGGRSGRPASSNSSRTARTMGADRWHCRTSSSTMTGAGPSSSATVLSAVSSGESFDISDSCQPFSGSCGNPTSPLIPATAATPSAAPSARLPPRRTRLFLP